MKSGRGDRAAKGKGGKPCQEEMEPGPRAKARAREEARDAAGQRNRSAPPAREAREADRARDADRAREADRARAAVRAKDAEWAGRKTNKDEPGFMKGEVSCQVETEGALLDRAR